MGLFIGGTGEWNAIRGESLGVESWRKLCCCSGNEWFLDYAMIFQKILNVNRIINLMYFSIFFVQITFGALFE